MEIINKPDLKVFASEAKSGEIAQFPDILRGWGITFEQTQGKPPLEWMNDAFNRVDLNNLYLLQQGVAEWQKEIRYPENSIVKKDGKLYLCLVENENNEPSQYSDKWSLLIKKATTEQEGTVQLTNELGTSTSLVATQKLVNDTKINLESSKQDKLTFIGNGPEVMKKGAFGLGFGNFYNTEAVDNINSTEFTVISKNATDSEDVIALALANAGAGAGKSVYYDGFGRSTNRPVWGLQDASNKTSYFFYYTQENTSVDSSGFIRASGNKETFTKDLITQSTGSSTTSVMSQKAVTDQLNSIKSEHGLGYGQNWVDVTSQRSAGTTYTNNTGKPIVISAIMLDNGRGFSASIFVDGIEVNSIYFEGGFDVPQDRYFSLLCIIPANSRYGIINIGAKTSIHKWNELR